MFPDESYILRVQKINVPPQIQGMVLFRTLALWKCVQNAVCLQCSVKMFLWSSNLFLFCSWILEYVSKWIFFLQISRSLRCPFRLHCHLSSLWFRALWNLEFNQRTVARQEAIHYEKWMPCLLSLNRFKPSALQSYFTENAMHLNILETFFNISIFLFRLSGCKFINPFSSIFKTATISWMWDIHLCPYVKWRIAAWLRFSHCTHPFKDGWSWCKMGGLKIYYQSINSWTTCA